MGCSNDRNGCYVMQYRSTGCVEEGTNTWVVQTTAMVVMYMFI